MERKRNIFIILFFCCLGPINAQYAETIYKAYINSDMVTWKRVIDQMENSNGKTNAQTLELINYQYGYIAWCIGEKKEKEAEEYLEQAEKHIEQLESRRYELAELYAYKAAFVGYKIGLDPYKAPFIGMESIEYANKSVNLDPNNALGQTQLGNIKYYMPSFMGGSKELALSHYLQTIRIMETKVEPTIKNWNYLNLLAALINYYKENGDLTTAQDYCIKTLQIEPQFDWVKNTLYPEILKLLKNG